MFVTPWLRFTSGRLKSRCFMLRTSCSIWKSLRPSSGSVIHWKRHSCASVFHVDEIARLQPLVGRGEIVDVDLDVVAVVLRLRLFVSVKWSFWSRPMPTVARTFAAEFSTRAGAFMTLL